MSQPLAVYHPGSIDDALAILTELGDTAKVVAGSTALTIMLRQGLIEPQALVSIASIPGLATIAIDGDELVLGALVRHRDVETSPLVQAGWPVLATTFGLVANVRVRNAATVGGVLAESDYASDPPAVFVALDAAVEVTGPSGRRSVPAAEFFVAFYETVLAGDELVTAVRVPRLPAGARAVYEKFVTRSSEDRPCVGVAAVVGLDKGRVTDLRVCVGAAAETPQRFPEIEALARGTTFDGTLVSTIADRYADAIETLDDMRGSAWYRTEMVRVWVRRALERAAGEG
ncbi:MAG TPA: xanthine dehydrogenase family protein subunit M [Candidatus Limnocylindrales bacterium]|jgi:carbon-monoxide dehydrogenase medium subunit